MRTIVLAILFAGSLSSLAAAGDPPAKPARAAPVARRPGDAPAIELSVAVERAKAVLKANKVDTSKQYLQAAAFDFGKRQWTVTWQLPNARGGTTFVIIPEVGEPIVTYGE
jgi:hypothetical protein